MNFFQNRTWMIVSGLVLVMALTRFNHFGSSMTLPDASLAVFFLGGLYLARLSGAKWIFAVLLVEAAMVDYYAITVQNTSDWCVTSAYGFLALAYAAMWFAGRWISPRHDLTGKSLLGLFATVMTASVVAFLISNVSFFLFSGRYAEMNALEYASRVEQYLGSYVAVALMYVACAIGVQMIFALLKGKAHRDSHVA